MEPKAPYAECSECPLRDQPHVFGRGPEQVDYVVVGEAPGRQEVRTGVPFIGPSGKLLDKVLAYHNIKRAEVYVTNTVLCRPPLKDNKNTPPPAEAVKRCSQRLKHEIEGRKPKMVLALGAPAAKTVLGTREGITALRIGGAKMGGLVDVPVVATYHPAAALRNPDLFPSIVSDVKKLHASIGWEPTQYTVADHLEDAISLLWSQARYPMCSYDIENAPPFDKHEPNLLCIGVSEREGHSIVYPEHVVNDRRFLDVLDQMFQLTTTRWATQFGDHDTGYLWGAGVRNARVDEDTGLLHYATNEIKGTHDLEQLATEFLGAPNYKKQAKGNTPVWELPPDVLHGYNATDADVTHRLISILRKDAEADGTYEMYRTLLIPGLNAISRVEYRGMKIDEEMIAEYDARLSKECEALEAELKPFVDNPRSPPQLKAAFHERETELDSTDKAHLKDMLAKNTDPQIEHYTRLLLEYRDKQKTLSTYVRGMSKRAINGRVHSRFLLHGTESGRLSSRDPNLQNITQGELRGMFVASDPHRVLLSADYKGIELRVAAILLKSPWLLQAFREGRDIHMEVANSLFGEGHTPRQYRNGKTVTFGIFYDQHAPSLAAQLGLSVRETQAMIDNWKARVPELETYFAETRDQINAQGYLRSHYGRLRRFWLMTDENRLDRYREGYNFRIQSAASDITLRSLIRIDNELPELEPVVTVHDSLTFDIDAKDVEDAKREVTRIMTDTPDWDVPTIVDWKEGYRWS